MSLAEVNPDQFVQDASDGGGSNLSAKTPRVELEQVHKLLKETARHLHSEYRYKSVDNPKVATLTIEVNYIENTPVVTWTLNHRSTLDNNRYIPCARHVQKLVYTWSDPWENPVLKLYVISKNGSGLTDIVQNLHESLLAQNISIEPVVPVPDPASSAAAASAAAVAKQELTDAEKEAQALEEKQKQEEAERNKLEEDIRNNTIDEFIEPVDKFVGLSQILPYESIADADTDANSSAAAARSSSEEDTKEDVEVTKAALREAANKRGAEMYESQNVAKKVLDACNVIRSHFKPVVSGPDGQISFLPFVIYDTETQFRERFLEIEESGVFHAQVSLLAVPRQSIMLGSQSFLLVGDEVDSFCFILMFTLESDGTIKYSNLYHGDLQSDAAKKSQLYNQKLEEVYSGLKRLNPIVALKPPVSEPAPIPVPAQTVPASSTPAVITAAAASSKIKPRPRVVKVQSQAQVQAQVQAAVKAKAQAQAQIVPPTRGANKTPLF